MTPRTLGDEISHPPGTNPYVQLRQSEPYRKPMSKRLDDPVSVSSLIRDAGLRSSKTLAAS